MMGPHWNPRATEIAIVLEGKGMVTVACGSGNTGKPKCQNMRFKVGKGDAFVVSRFYPMAQMSFNNESFVFMGFSTATQKNYPQFLAGKRSVLKTLDKSVLAASVNVTNTTIDQILNSQGDSFTLRCVSCAEAEERKMIEEIERKKEEEEARKREEEAREREEEERKREEEEARKREEEAREREEEERKREEEEARKREEEAREREEEERKREEEEARKREEQEREREEARQREEERKRKEEQARKREEQERAMEEEERKREEQEEAEREQRKQEAAAGRREQEERDGKRKEEEGERSQEDKQYRIIFEGRRALKMRSI